MMMMMINDDGGCAAHLTGAPTNAACLNRLQKKFGNIIIAKDRPDAKALLDSGVVGCGSAGGELP